MLTRRQAARAAGARPAADAAAGTGAALLLAVHGTRDARGTAAARDLAAQAARIAGVRVRLGFADVCAPSVAEAAAGIEGPLVVVPAFLAAGYHVRRDIPAQLAAAGRADAVLTEPVGADPRLIEAARRRLVQAGARPGDAVVLAAAGSLDPGALAEVEGAAARLAAAIGAPVRVGYAATARPAAAEAVAAARAEGAGRVAVASWLLAPGLFHTRLAESGAEVVAAPLCGDGAAAEAVAARYRAAAVRM